MPRLHQVSRAEVTDPSVLATYNAWFGDRCPVAEPGTAAGNPGDSVTVCALVPEVLAHLGALFQFYRSPKRVLEPKLREMGQVRAAWLRGSQFVYSQHCKSLRHHGATEAQVAAIPHWAATDLFSEKERTALAYTDALVLQDGRVSDAFFAHMKTLWTDVEILEFTYTVCCYSVFAVMSRALRLEFDDRDDPVVEVSAPPEFSLRDIHPD